MSTRDHQDVWYSFVFASRSLADLRNPSREKRVPNISWCFTYVTYYEASVRPRVKQLARITAINMQRSTWYRARSLFHTRWYTCSPFRKKKLAALYVQTKFITVANILQSIIALSDSARRWISSWCRYTFYLDVDVSWRLYKWPNMGKAS